MTLESLRTEYRACLKLALYSDSPTETAQLLQLAYSFLQALRGTCPHEHIVVTGEDQTRVCLMCGWNLCGLVPLRTRDEENFSHKTPMRRFYTNPPAEVLRPLRYKLADAIEAASHGSAP